MFKGGENAFSVNTYFRRKEKNIYLQDIVKKKCDSENIPQKKQEGRERDSAWESKEIYKKSKEKCLNVWERKMCERSRKRE